MIRPAPRIITIDDNQKDLDELTEGINRYGAACLPFHFTGDTKNISSCPHVRVIFADLHLNETGSGGNNTQHFSTIGSLILDTIKPSGPYLLILWTQYPEDAKSLREFLDERLPTDTPKPLDVIAIDKKILREDAEGNTLNIEKLVEEITSSFNQFPQITALLNWEEMVLGAAGDTVSSIFDLAGKQNRDKEVSRILAKLAVGATGKAHIEGDRFHAVNEALLPILTDRIASMHLKNDDRDIWQKAFDSSDIRSRLLPEEAAKLNRLVQIDLATDNGARSGSVITLPERFSGESFEEQFGLEQEKAASEQFSCKKPEEKLSWVLIQCQAICDYAQNKPGPLPYYLGLELSYTLKKHPKALWVSPPFEKNGSTVHLHVNARFPISITPKFTEQENVRYRLREQLLNDLIHHIHSYGARPGMLRF